jgi:hypothetical protein
MMTFASDFLLVLVPDFRHPKVMEPESHPRQAAVVDPA